ncbi:eukaryotic translation initiation factor 4E class II [Macrolepiota fuliginosa MF-IS2]|uniref:Eukaryotic translation initiation factor 4E class II n=1 Tax=Macrolepiota fuliginosa MF-IS2 TaxID=1400762 RepID=A0A9P6C950_9AGAR|nr:eukaryotic translation initiation factor 4E class II [Macrolepiota fuliginosa MF-IS2]
MASYFNSNHTTSRFLANNQNSVSVSAPAQSAAAPSPAAIPVRSRAPSSKHFSTSVNPPPAADRAATGTASAPSAGNGSVPAVHPLRNTWVFWFRQQRAPGNKNVNYEEGIKKISAFRSVESFWSLWTHLAPPSGLQPTTDYLLFHTGVRRPIWEDPLNISGGKWIIRVRKGIADRLWEDLVLAVIGDQFDECGSGDGTEWPEICGCTISVRQNEDIISLWNRYEVDFKVRERIRDTLKRVLNLPSTTTLEYKTNNDSMQDRSSFRTPNLHDRTPHP